MASSRKADDGEHLSRVRRICLALPESGERLSHGEPTFFVRKKAFTMFANNHHNDGHMAVWVPAPPGVQTMLIQTSPATYYRPPYVGGAGWVGIELDQIGDDELALQIVETWRMVAPKTVRKSLDPGQLGFDQKLHGGVRSDADIDPRP